MTEVTEILNAIDTIQIMKRRTVLQSGLLAGWGIPLLAALKNEWLEEATEVLHRATMDGLVSSAVLHVVQRDYTYARSFGTARNEHAMFLLGSISKPIAVTAFMTLFDRGEFKLDDRLNRYLPEFTGDARNEVTIRHLLTHTSGLPDQLPENDALRRRHASLADFAKHAIRTPLQFAPGTKYAYSSMAILLASCVAEKISGTSILDLVDRTVLQPLDMKHSAQGLGRFKMEDMVLSQTDHAAPESGGGDPTAKEWDWNSRYWRTLGAPWGGTHASAPDIASFLSEFLNETGVVVKPATARMMTSNQNPLGIAPRSLGWNVGASAGSPGCSEKTFGHTGSTGTIAWCDATTGTICVVLTSLPAKAVANHPRDLAAACVAKAIGH